jgi:hypothetical protein
MGERVSELNKKKAKKKVISNLVVGNQSRQDLERKMNYYTFSNKLYNLKKTHTPSKYILL